MRLLAESLRDAAYETRSQRVDRSATDLLELWRELTSMYGMAGGAQPQPQASATPE